jgi:hypothetical protein
VLALLGEVFATSHTLNISAHSVYEALQFRVMAEAQGFVALEKAPSVVAVGHAGVLLGLAQLARWAHLLPR